jgi:glutathione S-transferase
MLFYDSAMPAPNPRRVRIFAAEKGITLPTQDVSIMKGEHKSEDFKAVNPLGQTPALKLDDGTCLSESVAICRYLEALHPEPPLFGSTPTEIAQVEMWSRRVELRLMVPTGMIWIHTHPFTARVVPHQYKEFGESNRTPAPTHCSTKRSAKPRTSRASATRWPTYCCSPRSTSAPLSA